MSRQNLNKCSQLESKTRSTSKHVWELGMEGSSTQAISQIPNRLQLEPLETAGNQGLAEMSLLVLKCLTERLSMLLIFSVWLTTEWLHLLLSIWIPRHQRLSRYSTLMIWFVKLWVLLRQFTSLQLKPLPSESKLEEDCPTSRLNFITTTSNTSQLRPWKMTQSFRKPFNQQCKLPDNCWQTTVRTRNFAGSDWKSARPEKWTGLQLRTKLHKRAQFQEFMLTTASTVSNSYATTNADQWASEMVQWDLTRVYSEQRWECTLQSIKENQISE